MKRIISISLASSKRNHNAIINIEDQKYSLERYGTDGDFKKAKELFLKYDGKVSAFGLGGIDYFLGINKMHRIPSAWKLTSGLKTRVFDGSGIKESIDVNALNILSKKIDFKTKKVFMVCACNRSGMAKYLEKKSKKIIYGDFMFGLKIPLSVKNLVIGEIFADMVLPIATRLPYNYLYPIDRKSKAKSRFQKYFDWADVIVGDYHYISRYAPKDLKKIVITTTLTKSDIETMRQKGVSLLAATTPSMDGRYFGTNMIEALLFSRFGEGYIDHINRMNFKPDIFEF